MNKVSEAVIAYQSNKSDDYDIRDYRVGDSLKDIHYKISYKLSKLMIKDKITLLKTTHYLVIPF